MMQLFGRLPAFVRRPVVFVVAVCLIRGGVMWLRAGQLANDPDGYRALAGNLLATGVFGHERIPTAYRPPLYPLLLAGCSALADSTVPIAILHVLLGVATALLTVVLARKWGLGDAAPLAGLLVACDPILLNQSTLIMTETLAAFLSVLALVLITASGERQSGGFAALAGIALGLAVLCRPTFLLWLAMVAVCRGWFAGGWRLRLAGALLSAATVTLLPWAVRNQMQFGRPIITTTHGGYTLLLGNNPDYYQHLAEARWGAVWHADRLDAQVRATRSPDELANDRHEYALAWQHIRRQPGMFALACLARLGRFWGVVPHDVVTRDSVQTEPLLIRGMRYAIAAWYAGVFLLAIVACGQLRTAIFRPPWLWGFLLAISFTAAHAVYWSDLRMRAPLAPVISLLAVCGARRLAATPPCRAPQTARGTGG